MSLFVELNLPAIPEEIQLEIKEFVEEYIKTWSPTPDDCYNQVYPHETLNIVKRKVLIDKNNKNAVKFINSIFPEAKEFGMFLLINEQDEPAIMPPHTDFNRELAINFIIETGGDNVETCFYKQVDEPAMVINQGHIMPRYFNEKNLEQTGSIVFKKNSWVAFDSQNPHAVKNISGKRILVTMTADGNLLTLINRRPDLIKYE